MYKHRSPPTDSTNVNKKETVLQVVYQIMEQLQLPTNPFSPSGDSCHLVRLFQQKICYKIFMVDLLLEVNRRVCFVRKCTADVALLFSYYDSYFCVVLWVKSGINPCRSDTFTCVFAFLFLSVIFHSDIDRGKVPPRAIAARSATAATLQPARHSHLPEAPLIDPLTRLLSCSNTKETLVQKVNCHSNWIRQAPSLSALLDNTCQVKKIWVSWGSLN